MVNSSNRIFAQSPLCTAAKPSLKARTASTFAAAVGSLSCDLKHGDVELGFVSALKGNQTAQIFPIHENHSIGFATSMRG
jgi:hypothetical protein